jgi:Ca2+-binding EF-hand superfamily protein
MAPSRFLFVVIPLLASIGSCGKREGAEITSPEKPALQRYDSDKDGQLSEVERTTMNREFVERFDADKDGKLNVSERESVRNLGKVTVSPAKREISLEAATAFVSNLDRDQDGGISEGDVDEKRWKAISRADRDGNGKVTAEEWAGQGRP